MQPEPFATRTLPLRTLIAAVGRRLQLLHALEAASLAVVAALVMALPLSRAIGSRTVVVAGAVLTSACVAAIAFRVRAGRRTSRACAEQVERFAPESHNVIITAEELLRDQGAVRGWMMDRVVAQAAAVAARIPPAGVVPLRRASLLLFGALLVSAAIVWGLPARVARTVATAVSRPDETPPALSRMSLEIAIESPAYTGVPVKTVTNPERVELLQGSTLRVALTGDPGAHLRLGTAPVLLRQTGERRVAELRPAESGYLAVEPSGSAQDRRLVPLTVLPDRAPVVRIDKPAKDLLLPTAQSTVPVTVSTSDDFGLRSLELRYTKVSGSGEQFEFVEGSLPLEVARTSERQWSAAGSFSLAALGLEPGDSLIYRAVARDARPGEAGAATSDTYFVEVAGPGQVALPGFEMPPDRERYALSQQMIVLKIQRLRARERTLSREALAQETGAIAAEQRAVRSNFIFLLGGHVEDEEEEAEQSSEISEGRLQNNARREINTAIRFMSQAEQGLIAADTGQALPPAKSAVDALQRAFGHNRYFLKTLPVRSKIDPARRLTGELAEAVDWRRDIVAADSDPKQRAAREILARLLELAPSLATSAATAVDDVRALAERALAVDPGAAEWQRTSKALQALAGAAGQGAGGGNVREAVQQAVTALVEQVKRSAQRVPGDGEYTGSLRGAMAEESRRR